MGSGLILDFERTLMISYSNLICLDLELDPLANRHRSDTEEKQLCQLPECVESTVAYAYNC